MRQGQDLATVDGANSMHGEALLQCLCILLVCFLHFFTEAFPLFPVMGSVSCLQQITYLKAVYVSLWFAHLFAL